VPFSLENPETSNCVEQSAVAHDKFTVEDGTCWYPTRVNGVLLSSLMQLDTLFTVKERH
jgi:hypothetical protein